VEEISKDQEAMVTMIEDLNRINRELTETREKLKGSEKLAILGKLSLGLSHELRNPLGVIENSAGILENTHGGDEEEVKKWTGRIKAQTRLCNRVIESVLGFSMHDFRSDDMITAEKVVHNALKKCRAEDKVKVETAVSRPIWLKGDEEQLVQAVSHIIDNSLASVESAGEISIALKVQRTINGSGPEQLEIIIKDTGPGLEKEQIPLIFEPFYSTKEGSLGLGLPLCNAIVRKHSGRLSVKSVDGVTCFTIKLPIAEGSGSERN
jgi:signal transduction histidine kinase